MTAHYRCDCSYSYVCPWDRYCAGCGKSLTTVDDRSLVTLPQSVKVGTDAAAGFTVGNASPVVVHLSVPRLDQHGEPPRWLRYDRASGSAANITLAPGESATIQFYIDRQVIDEMLRQPALRDVPVAFPLRVYTDEDYRRQEHDIVFSLLGQADLRPAAIEFPSIWLSNPASLRLPFELYNASGERMVVVDVRTRCPDEEHQDIVDALIPSGALAGFRNQQLPPGQTLALAIETGSVAKVLEVLTREKGPRVPDAFAARRKHPWLEKWDTLTRVRFVVEATLRGAGNDPVPVVRSLVVLTLVRPPLLRDATPEDELWKRLDGRVANRGIHELGDAGACEFVADLTNESAMPVRVDEVVSNRSWVEVLDPRLGAPLAPGETFHVKVRVDVSKRSETELRASTLDAEVSLRTWPPTPLPQLDKLTFKAQSTIVLPGSLGIDFGTSNCAVCYMPDGDVPVALSPNPVALFIDDFGGKKDTNLPSIALRRLRSIAADREPDFSFGSDAQALEEAAPENVIRGIKRMISVSPDAEYRLRSEDPNTDPVQVYRAVDVASRMLRHIMRQAERLAIFSDELRSRILDAANNTVDETHPSVDDINAATAFRFRKAVFTHPVDASDKMKRLIYECAIGVNLAHADDGSALTFEKFVEQRLIDESSAAIGQFVFAHRELLTSPRRRPHRILCIDIGGGTTDISAIYLDTAKKVGPRRGPELRLLFRKGINDFAGMDIDREIATRLILGKVNDRLRDHGGPPVAVDVIRRALGGVGADVLSAHVRNALGPGADEAAVAAVVQSVIATALFLRHSAESVKKLAAAEGEGVLRVTLPKTCPTAGANGYSTLPDVVPVDVSFAEVNALIGEMMIPRLAAIDDAVAKARWSWSEVDILMFVGQTCRSPALRQTVLDYVRGAREGSLPTVVMPPPDPGSALPLGHGVVYFDPKVCVPAGAALMGTEWNNLQLSQPERLTCTLAGEGWAMRAGDPLPGFACTSTVRDESNIPFVWIRRGRAPESRREVPTDHDPEEVYTVVIDRRERAWVALTSADESLSVSDAPPELSSAILQIPTDRRTTYGLNGPFVRWFALVSEPSGDVR